MTSEWYSQLEAIKLHLISQDPQLKLLFKIVDDTGFQLHTIIKEPYTALLGAIIGQKISYKTAKSLRGQLYQRYGTNITPDVIKDADLSFLGVVPATIIANVTDYIILNNIDMNTEEGIRSLINVTGIGSWTIDTTLLTSLMHWDIFPLNDKFLQARMVRLYGKNCDIKAISDKWSPYRSVITWNFWRWF